MIVAPRKKSMPATKLPPSARPSTNVQPLPLKTAAPQQHPTPPLRVVDPLPQTLPPWLNTLIALRKLSTPVLVLMVLGILPLYGWSVYTQQAWGKTYRQLEETRREEHTIRLLNAAHLYQVTQKAEHQPQGLTRKGPHNTLFVQPAPLPATNVEKAEQPQVTPEWALPVGY